LNFDVTIILNYWPKIIEGILNTLLICALSLPSGFILGLVVCSARMSKFGWLRNPALAFIEVIRNTPFLIQVFMVYYVLPFYGIRMEPITAGVGCLSVYAAAYFAEIVRGAIQSVPAGQSEAARALALPNILIMRRIIFPQMLGYLIPPLTNMGMTLIKESSVLSVITIAELTYVGQFIIGKAFAPVEMFSVIAVIYWLITALFGTGMQIMEKHFTRFSQISRSNV
jgi:His/Glu/Gln/Arg/opine family amino acid ABC transporter permease subunit